MAAKVAFSFMARLGVVPLPDRLLRGGGGVFDFLGRFLFTLTFGPFNCNLLLTPSMIWSTPLPSLASDSLLWKKEEEDADFCERLEYFAVGFFSWEFYSG